MLATPVQDAAAIVSPAMATDVVPPIVVQDIAVVVAPTMLSPIHDAAAIMTPAIPAPAQDTIAATTPTMLVQVQDVVMYLLSCRRPWLLLSKMMDVLHQQKILYCKHR